MKILVTGGAGYIGSIATKRLVEEDHEVVVIDNLSKGKKELVNNRVKFYQIDLVDDVELEKVFEENTFDIVMHFAAYKAVGESMKNCPKYSDNIKGTLNLLNKMVKYNVKRIIFSSTAAVYSTNNAVIPITEESTVEPNNYYGFTKHKCEELIEWYSKIHKINYFIFRYFNVLGDGGLNYIDPKAENILPVIMDVLFEKKDKLLIYGNDYPTKDGTCIRDYVDINDIVEAHMLALREDKEVNQVINLGTSNGISVNELVSYVEKVTGSKIKKEIVGRREGDCEILITSNKKAKEILGWIPKVRIEEMIKSTYKAYKEVYEDE